MKRVKWQNNKKYKTRRIVTLLSFFIVVCVLLSFIKKMYFHDAVKHIASPSVDKALSKIAENPNDDSGNEEENMDRRENNFPTGADLDNHINELGIKGQKIAYLTFDDGPSPKTTPKILDILDRYNIKATFFLIGKQAADNKSLVLRESNEGDAIGNHTFTHNYKYIYKDTQNLLLDFDKCARTIHSILGPAYNIKYVRFPGGSFGKKLEPFRNAALSAGYSFIDWNSLNGDAEGNNIPPDKLFDTLKKTSRGKDTLVILMHDAPAKQTTIQALPQIIEYLKSEGYTFKTLG